LWLEEYLRDYPHTVLIVSHDRELLNRSVTSILHLSQGKLALYSGGYDRFEEARREKQRLDLKLKKKQDEERRHIEAFIIRFKAKASKATQAQSRVKALARMQPIASQVEERLIPFNFPNPKKAFASPLIRLEDAAVGYEPDRPVLQGLSLRLDADDRVGLLGANGNGKSTFAKLIAGRLAPMTGRTLRLGQDLGRLLRPAPDGRPAVRQDAVPAHRRPDGRMRPRPSAVHASAPLASAPTRPTHAPRTCRAARRRACCSRLPRSAGRICSSSTSRPTISTSDSREALVRALNDYEGAVILISHDRHLIEACATVCGSCGTARCATYEGDMEQYRDLCLAERGREGPRAKTKAGGAGKSTPQAARRQAAEFRATLAPLKSPSARRRRRSSG